MAPHSVLWSNTLSVERLSLTLSPFMLSISLSCLMALKAWIMALHWVSFSIWTGVFLFPGFPYPPVIYKKSAFLIHSSNSIHIYWFNLSPPISISQIIITLHSLFDFFKTLTGNLCNCKCLWTNSHAFHVWDLGGWEYNLTHLFQIKLKPAECKEYHMLPRGTETYFSRGLAYKSQIIPLGWINRSYRNSWGAFDIRPCIKIKLATKWAFLGKTKWKRVCVCVFK